jgi:preprotein translocase subunit SecA
LKSVELIHTIAGGDWDTRQIMRGLDFAIIDEADSVLADEATVPLIISVSGKNRLLKEAVHMALEISQSLYQDEDYRLLPNQFDIEMLPQGKKKSKMPCNPCHLYGVPTKDPSISFVRH